ncbi:MAG TPA: nickel-dependent hydrogenase large subunit [Methanocella sp.]|uniref:nickel-dependent hydrogenase large subunit n=1 Tax=Methanocella sp. TaxID=2052833 RepID=UPI002BB72827|nr:nickel-dependent hydrogenase large subunit [Methanocella sp.]HTY90532.1 nickel-dependent hydrogenase large subunit [Methanocella sp.]
MRITIDPVTRLSSGLRVSVELEDGAVTGASASGMSYRGLERMLVGRPPADAPYFTQRICGMCSSPHATASAGAVESAAGAMGLIPKDALVIRNLLNGLGWMKNHVEHLYLGFLPDLADPSYGDALNSSGLGNLLWKELKKRYAAASGQACGEALLCIKAIGRAEGILGGRSPCSPAIVPGGVTARPARGDIDALDLCLADVDSFLQKRLVGELSLDEWLQNTHDQDTGFAYDYVQELPMGDLSSSVGWGDLPLFLMFGSRMFARDVMTLPAYIGLDTMGGYPIDDQLIGFLSYGSFYNVRDDSGQFRDGYTAVEDDKANAFEMPAGFTPGSMTNIYRDADKVDTSLIVEHVHASFYDYGDSMAAKTPLDGETSVTDKASAIGFDGTKYSFVKAPRYGRVPCEVGPLARHINAREKLVIDAMRRLFAHNTTVVSYPMASVYTRTIARMQETLLLSRMLHAWLRDLEVSDDGRRYSVPVSVKANRTGSGLIEAPRGALGHWLKAGKDQMISNYQVVAPTTWNASPVCTEQKSGPIELALMGSHTTPSGYLPGSEANPVGIYHIIRSFDPCTTCAVHTIQRGGRG